MDPSDLFSIKIQYGSFETSGTFLPLGYEGSGSSKQLLRVSFAWTLLGTELCKRRWFCFGTLSELLPWEHLTLPHTDSTNSPSRWGELRKYGDQMHTGHNTCKATSFVSVTSLTKQDHLYTSR